MFHVHAPMKEPVYLSTFDAWNMTTIRSRASFIRQAKEAGVHFKADPSRWIGYSWSEADIRNKMRHVLKRENHG